MIGLELSPTRIEPQRNFGSYELPKGSEAINLFCSLRAVEAMVRPDLTPIESTRH